MYNFRVGDAVSAGGFVQYVKQPLDGGWQMLIDGQHGHEEIIDELLYRSLG